MKALIIRSDGVKFIANKNFQPLEDSVRNRVASHKTYYIHREVLDKTDSDEQIINIFETLSKERRKLFFILV